MTDNSPTPLHRRPITHNAVAALHHQTVEVIEKTRLTDEALRPWYEYIDFTRVYSDDQTDKSDDARLWLKRQPPVARVRREVLGELVFAGVTTEAQPAVGLRPDALWRIYHLYTGKNWDCFGNTVVIVGEVYRMGDCATEGETPTAVEPPGYTPVCARHIAGDLGAALDVMNLMSVYQRQDHLWRVSVGDGEVTFTVYRRDDSPYPPPAEQPHAST